MTTTKATMIANTKHETHSYYVIILTFSPVILHCNSSFAWCLDRKNLEAWAQLDPFSLSMESQGPSMWSFLQAGGTSYLAAQPSKRPEWKLQYSQSLDLGVAMVPYRTRLWEQPQGSPDSRRGEGGCASQ